MVDDMILERLLVERRTETNAEALMADRRAIEGVCAGRIERVVVTLDAVDFPFVDVVEQALGYTFGLSALLLPLLHPARHRHTRAVVSQPKSCIRTFSEVASPECDHIVAVEFTKAKSRRLESTHHPKSDLHHLNGGQCVIRLLAPTVGDTQVSVCSTEEAQDSHTE